jgi:prepilin-type N-terminal cleavage/methylation domain-containing protein
MTSSLRQSRSNAAFTLIELLVVIAIIAILAAILFPVFAQAKQAAKKTAALSNVKQMGVAIQLYLGDFDDMYPEAVRGGCTNQAADNNRIWTAQVHPYIKSKEIMRDPSSTVQWTGYRWDSSVAVPEFGLQPYDTPCGTGAQGLRGDLRSQNVGLNRQFFSYFICGSQDGHVGCKLPLWNPDPPAQYCPLYYTNASRIDSPAAFVLYGPTTPSCTVGVIPYVMSAVDGINAVGASVASMSSRQGEGMSLAFADGHAKFYRAAQDAQISQAFGSTNVRFSPVQNRAAVLRRAAGQGNAANGVLNCVNHNAAKVQWTVFVDLPGENPQLDALCSPQ